MAVQQVLRVFLCDDRNRVEQPLKIALFHKRSADIGHDEIAYEHCVLIWDIDQHCVVGFSALDWNQIESRSADIHSRAAINLDIRLVVAHVVKAEVAAKKLAGKYAGRIELPLDLFLIVASAIKAYLWINRAKVLMATHMIPVSMREENRGERRKGGRIGTKGFECCLCRIRPGAGINSDQLPPILRNHKIVLGKFKAGESIDPFRDDLDDGFGCESMTPGLVFGKGCGQSDRLVEVPIPASPQILPAFHCVAVGQGQFPQMVVHLAQPPRVRSFVAIRLAPGKLVPSDASLLEEPWKLSPHDARHPVHYEDFSP